MLSVPQGVGEVVATDPRRSFVPVVAAMIALGVLDIVGAMLARSWSEHRSAIAMLGGLMVFGLLFVVYGKSLDYAELSTVTVGWVVLLQVGVVVLDRLQGVSIPPGRLTAIGLIIALQVYVIMSDLGQHTAG